MTKKCTHKDKNGKVCGHINADGNSYCVKCGNLLDGVNPKIVVNKSDYNLNLKKVEEVEAEKKRLQKDIDDLKTKGYAPSGFHLEKNKSIWEEYSKKTLPILEYDRLVRKANQSWWEKLKETIKKWWDDTGSFIAFFLFIIGGVVFIVILIDVFVTNCTNEDKGVDNVVKIVKRDGLWGVVKGEDVVLPFEYDSIVADKWDTKYSRTYKNGNVGLIDNTSGKKIIPCDYKNVGDPNHVSFRGKLIAVQKIDGKWNYVDYSGKPTKQANLKLDYAEWWLDADMGLVGMRINGEMRYGYVDETGYVKLSCKYAAANNFFEGLALVKNAKYGPWICINEDGEEQYRMKYTLADIYQESLIAVTNDLEWTSKTLFGFVDRNGELVIGIYFTPWILGDGTFYYPRFNNGKAKVRYMGKNGWIDKTGRFTPEN